MKAYQKLFQTVAGKRLFDVLISPSAALGSLAYQLEANQPEERAPASARECYSNRILLVKNKLVLITRSDDIGITPLK